jgi:Ni/Co efflux regulator RcnB
MGSAKWSILLAATVIGASASLAYAQEPGHNHQGEPQREPQRQPQREHAAEPHPGPRGYERVNEPHGWNARPATVDRDAYRHNFQAARSYRIGPYHRPSGWHEHRWVYGEVLPRAYWAPEYIIGDYWLFALEVPPAGYEWIRDGNDALLIDVSSGEILQVEYGVFS